MEVCKRSIERDIAEKAWFYAFVYPGEYNTYQMNKLIFGGIGNRAHRAIEKEKFVEKGYLKRISSNRTGRPEKILLGTADPLISKIKERTSLAPFDEDALRDKLESPAFKYLIKNSNAKEPKNFFFDVFEHILFFFEVFIIAMDEKGALTRNSHGIITKEQYEDAKNKIRKKIQLEIAKELERIEASNRREDMKTLEILEDFFVFLIFPEALLTKIKGSSIFGEMYNAFKEMFSTISNLSDLDIEQFLNES